MVQDTRLCGVGATVVQVVGVMERENLGGVVEVIIVVDSDQRVARDGSHKGRQEIVLDPGRVLHTKRVGIVDHRVCITHRLHH